jgi:hypothetical protein
LVTAEEIQRAHLAIRDTPPQPLQRRHEATPIRDLEFDIAALGDRCRLARLLCRDTAGFFAQDRQPGIRDPRYHAKMQRARRRHQHAIESARLQHRSHIRMSYDAVPFHRGARLLRRIRNPDDTHHLATGQGSQMRAPHPASADHPEAEPGHGQISTVDQWSAAQDACASATDHSLTSV